MSLYLFNFAPVPPTHYNLSCFGDWAYSPGRRDKARYDK